MQKNLIIEGRNERTVTNLSRELIKRSIDFIKNQRSGMFSTKIDASNNLIEPHLKDHLSLVQLKIKHVTDPKLNANPALLPIYIADAYYDPDNYEIKINILLSNKFNNGMINVLISKLKNTLAHEIQHLTQQIQKQDVFNNIENHDITTIDGLYSYYMDPIEIDAYSKGLYKQAKYLKVPFTQVLDSYIKRMLASAKRLVNSGKAKYSYSEAEDVFDFYFRNEIIKNVRNNFPSALINEEKMKTREIIRESIIKALIESRIVTPPTDEYGDEQILLDHAIGIFLTEVKKLFLAIPNNVMGSDKNSKDTIRKLHVRSISPGRSMTTVGKDHLGNLPDFIAAEFLSIGQDNEIYFTNHVRDLSAMGRKNVGIFLGHSAHGTTFREIFVKSMFSKMHITKGSFSSFQKDGVGKHYVIVRRSPQEMIDAIRMYVFPDILSSINISADDLSFQDVNPERRTNDWTTLKDIQSNTLGFPGGDHELAWSKIKTFKEIIEDLNMDIFQRELNKGAHIINDMLKSDVEKTINQYIDRINLSRDKMLEFATEEEIDEALLVFENLKKEI